MKKSILFAIIYFISCHASASDKGPGCGAGKVVFEGKDGLGSHLGATSVNGTVNSIVPSHQTFAMTSGVLGCDTEQTVKIDQKWATMSVSHPQECPWPWPPSVLSPF